MHKVIVITGPTAVGKTKLSIEIAKKYNGEIINCDAVQVYKGLDIGSAKVTKEEKEKFIAMIKSEPRRFIAQEVIDFKDIDIFEN